MARTVKLKRKPTRAVKQPVTTTRVGINALTPALRREALRLSNGDVSRIEVCSATEAVVRN